MVHFNYLDDEVIPTIVSTLLENTSVVWYSFQGLPVEIINTVFPVKVPKYIGVMDVRIGTLIPLQKYIENRSSIHGLYLGLDCTQFYVQPIFLTFESLQNLLYLNLEGQFDETLITILSEVIDHGRNLIYLRIYNQIEEAIQMHTLSTAIARNYSLRTLELEIHIDIQNTEILFNGIIENKSLSSFHYSNPQGDQNHLEKFTKLFEADEKLESISFSADRNSIDGLLSSIDKNKSMVMLENYYNGVNSLEFDLEVEKILNRNHHLKNISTKSSAMLLKDRRLLFILNEVLPMEICDLILDFMIYEQMGLQNRKNVISVLLDRSKLGKITGPFPFSEKELIRRCFILNDLEEEEEYNHDLIAKEINDPRAPEWFHGIKNLPTSIE
jgi:hypothetical protein